MKRSQAFSTILVLALLTGACSSTPSNEQSQAPVEESGKSAEAKKDVSELTFREVYDMVFGDFGKRREWHGEEMPNTLTDMLAITAGEPCGEGNCGEGLLLTNNADRPIGVVVKGAYDIDGDQGYMATEYEIEAGQSIDIGCSHLCYDGKSYLFDRKIVGSWYMDE
ncbi:MAG: hypothetical protein Tsb0034_11160 [Ekhidna sp.]